MSIKRVKSGKGHKYVHRETGETVPGVTTILGDGVPKPALVDWAARATAEAAVDRWDEFGAKPPSARLKELEKARYGERDRAANRGTAVHELGERLVHGEEVQVPEELEGHVQAYVAFLDEFDVQPVLVERVIYSRTHAYCGTFDLIADLVDPDRGHQRWLLDLKTNKSGVFGEMALQLAAYRFADVVVEDDGTEADVPEVDATGVVHVTADGYRLVPVEADETVFRSFLYVQQVARFQQFSRDLVGAPVDPPTASTFRLQEIA